MYLMKKVLLNINQSKKWNMFLEKKMDWILYNWTLNWICSSSLLRQIYWIYSKGKNIRKSWILSNLKEHCSSSSSISLISSLTCCIKLSSRITLNCTTYLCLTNCCLITLTLSFITFSLTIICLSSSYIKLSNLAS